MNHDNLKWFKLSALMPAVAMIFTDQSVLPVALPTIQKQLDATHTALWWCVNSYMLVSALLLLGGGKLGDRYGHRKVFLIGMILFALASALCGISPNVYWLIAGRSLQGVGAALMIPSTSVLIMSFFPQNERGKAIGINVSFSSLFLIFAPLIGGYLTEKISWHWIFWINLPLAALGVFLVLYFVPVSPKGSLHFDLYGFSSFVVCFSSLVIWIMQGSEWGWTSPVSLFLLLMSFCFLYLFYQREKFSKHPLLDLSLFRHHIYKAVNISVFTIQFMLMITIYRAVFFQNALGWSPIKSGMISSLTSFPVLFMSPIGGWLADRSGPKVPITIGFTMIICSFFWLAYFIENSTAFIIAGLFAFGIGIPLIFTPSYSSAMGAIPAKKAGMAFGILATVRALGATLGVAVISSIAGYLQFSYFSSLLNRDVLTEGLNFEHLETLTSENQKMPIALSQEQWDTVQQYFKNSQVDSFIILHLAMAFILIAVFALVLTLYRRKASHHPPESPAEGWD